MFIFLIFKKTIFLQIPTYFFGKNSNLIKGIFQDLKMCPRLELLKIFKIAFSKYSKSQYQFLQHNLGDRTRSLNINSIQYIILLPLSFSSSPPPHLQPHIFVLILLHQDKYTYIQGYPQINFTPGLSEGLGQKITLDITTNESVPLFILGQNFCLEWCFRLMNRAILFILTLKTSPQRS